MTICVPVMSLARSEQVHYYISHFFRVSSPAGGFALLASWIACGSMGSVATLESASCAFRMAPGQTAFTLTPKRAEEQNDPRIPPAANGCVVEQKR